MGPRESTGVRTYALWQGADLAIEFGDAGDALNYMASHADELLGGDYALLVFDDIGRSMVALVDARDDGGAHLRIEALERAIDDYSLWEPGRRGHAAAHRKLMEVRRDRA